MLCAASVESRTCHDETLYDLSWLERIVFFAMFDLSQLVPPELG